MSEIANMTGGRTVAFLGTGIMGAPMARNLSRAGFRVRAWNRSAAKLAVLSRDGIPTFHSAVEAVAEASCIVIMLSTGEVVDEVLFSPDGQGRCVAEAAPVGAQFVVMSSIPVETARRQAERLSVLGRRYIDAPVSGGERGAKEGTLSIMAGGAADDVAGVVDLMSALGRLTHVGPCGTGQLTKLANQVIVGITIGAVAEALLLAKAGGADLAAVRSALTGGFADSTILRQHGERMVSSNFSPGAYCHIQLKDLRTASALAGEYSLDLPITQLLKLLYTDACAHGFAELDHSALYLELAARSRAADLMLRQGNSTASVEEIARPAQIRE